MDSARHRQQADNDKLAFLQTQKALADALKEQKVLREKLASLEARNKPAKWANPVFIQRIDATRGRFDGQDGDWPPEQLEAEVKRALDMLENAKRTRATAEKEKKELDEEIEELQTTATRETEELLQSTAIQHKKEMLEQQMKLRHQLAEWATQKAELLSDAENMALGSQKIVHESSVAREGVEKQRKEIRRLANELRDDLTKSKQLRDSVDDAKTKVALIDNLKTEIEANKEHAEQLQKSIAEQRQYLRAVRVSAQAKAIISDLEKQTDELITTKEEAEKELESSRHELEELCETEKRLNNEYLQAQEAFKAEQMSVLVVEAELRELKAEFERVKANVIQEGRRNVELQKSLREEKMNATMRFLLTHANEIHRADKVQSSLVRVRDKFEMRSTLPPLARKSSLS